MAAPMTDVSVMDIEMSEICVVEATVATGFESVARAEAEEKLQASVQECHKGRIRIECPIDRVEKVIQLGCVDHCRVLLTHIPDFGFTDDEHDNLLRLRRLVGDVNWPLGIKVWKKFFSFEHPIADTPEAPVTDFGDVMIPPPREHQMEKSSRKKSKGKKWKKKKKENNMQNNEQQAERQDTVNDELKAPECAETQKDDINKDNESKENCISTEEVKDVIDSSTEDAKISAAKKPRVRENPWDPTKPSFRVTCNRHGNIHNFESMAAAANMGGAVYRYFGWNVKMTEFDIEVILQIEDQEVSVCIGITKTSLHHRNITNFGPTTLRPTIAYNMLRLCEIKVGDVVCDPMCGTGSIPIQCSVSWPGTFNVCGDISKRCLTRTSDNIEFMSSQESPDKKRLAVDVVRWDTCRFPLKEQSIDVFVTDLPFGVRVGHKVDNWTLYPGTLLEMARVVRPLTGRACLLTEDKKCMIKILQSPVVSKYWFRSRTLGINMGGLAAGVYVLARTKKEFTRETIPTVTPDTADETTLQEDT